MSQAARPGRRASHPRARRAGCAVRSRHAAWCFPRRAAMRAGRESHRPCGQSGVGDRPARARRIRRSCTAPAAVSCGCPLRARRRSTHATSPPDRRTRCHRACGGHSGTRTPACNRPRASRRTTAQRRHAACRDRSARRSGTSSRARSRTNPPDRSGARPCRPSPAGMHANAGWQCPEPAIALVPRLLQRRRCANLLESRASRPSCFEWGHSRPPPAAMRPVESPA